MDAEMVEYVADKHKLNCFMDVLFLIQVEDAQNQIKDHRHPAHPLQNVTRSIINVKGFCGKWGKPTPTGRFTIYYNFSEIRERELSNYIFKFFSMLEQADS